MDAILSEWAEFNLAMAGATAALAGLVIVAASVNIAEIVRTGTITARLAAAIASLVLALVASALGLVPSISAAWFGGILLCTALGSAVFQIHAARKIIADTSPDVRAPILKSVLGFLPVAAYVASAVTVMFEHPSGLYFGAAGCVLAIVAAIVVSWVALVEVLR